MKRLFLSLIALLLTATLTGCGKEPIQPEGNGIGSFSVSATKQVAFAPGNLAEDGRSFVDNQWTAGGYFGWGTGDHPGKTFEDGHDYQTFQDWGDNIDGGWRTLSKYEWKYLLFERADAENKLSLGSVFDMPGLIILPDNWTLPTGCTFIPEYSNYYRNRYSKDQWQQMEDNGAVFLVAGGYFQNSNYNSYGMVGFYWTSTPSEYNYISASCLCFNEGGFYIEDGSYRWFNQSVRLVRDKD